MQAAFDRRLEWGPQGVEAVADGGLVVIVDVLRFSTAVEAGVSRGAIVYPFRWRDDSAKAFAESVGAVLAGADPLGPSLSPASMLRVDAGDVVVLPSPNGSTCAAVASELGASVAAGCIRNARAIGERFREGPRTISVIPCGERWPDGSLRPAVEDFLAAGAILSHLGGVASPEARAAIAAWHHAEHRIEETLLDCASGRELIEMGLEDDVRYAAAVNVSGVTPVLEQGAFRAPLRAPRP